MALESIPTCPPTRIVAGDSETWDDEGFSHPRYGSFTSSGWTLTYELIGRAAKLEITATPQNSGWRTAMTATDSAGLKDPDGTREPETVRWVARVTDGTDVITVGQGTLQLLPDPSTLGAGYASEAEQELAQAKTARAKGITAYSIGGRTVTYATATELNRRIARLEYQVWREQHPCEVMPTVYGRFTEAR